MKPTAGFSRKLVPVVLLPSPAHTKSNPTLRKAELSPVKSTTGVPLRPIVPSRMKAQGPSTHSHKGHLNLHETLLLEARNKDPKIDTKCKTDRDEEWTQIHEASVYDAGLAEDVRIDWDASIVKKCEEVAPEVVDMFDARIIICHGHFKWYKAAREQVLMYWSRIVEYGPAYDACKADRVQDSSRYHAASLINEAAAKLIQKALGTVVRELGTKYKGPSPPDHPTESTSRMLARKYYLSVYQAARLKAQIAYQKVQAVENTTAGVEQGAEVTQAGEEELAAGAAEDDAAEDDAVEDDAAAVIPAPQVPGADEQDITLSADESDKDFVALSDDDESDEDFVALPNDETEVSQQNGGDQEDDEILEDQDVIDCKADEDLEEQAANISPHLAEFVSSQLQERLFLSSEACLNKKLNRQTFNARSYMYVEEQSMYDDLRKVAREFWQEIVSAEDWLLEFDLDESAYSTCVGNPEEVKEAVQELGDSFRSLAIEYWGQEILPADLLPEYNLELGLWARLCDHEKYKRCRERYISQLKNLTTDDALHQEYRRIKGILDHHINVDSLFAKVVKVDHDAAKSIQSRQKANLLGKKPDKWEERVQWILRKLDMVTYSNDQFQAVLDKRALPETPVELEHLFLPMNNYLVAWQERVKNGANVTGGEDNVVPGKVSMNQEHPKTPLVNYQSSPVRASPVKDSLEKVDEIDNRAPVRKRSIRKPLADGFAMDDEVPDGVEDGSDDEDEEEEEEEEGEGATGSSHLGKIVQAELMVAEADFTRAVANIAKKHGKDPEACYSYVQDQGEPRASRSINIWNAFKAYCTEHGTPKKRDGMLFFILE